MEGIEMSMKKEKSYLSEGIIGNILCRVPAKCVMRCQLVCPRWRCLTSDPVFIDSHLRNCPPSIPSILVANPTQGSGLDLFALDPNLAETRFTIHRFTFHSGKFSQKPCLLFSHGGIVVFGENLDLETESDPKFVILNPVWPECLTISFPKSLCESRIYGVYFHPLLKEYCSLLRIHEEDPYFGSTLRLQYKILILSSTPSVKTISNPFSNRSDKDDGNTLLINTYLYWLLYLHLPEGNFLDRLKNMDRNDIMEFDIMREEYMVIPCPIPSNTDCTRCRTQLLNIGGILSFLLVLTTEVTIWSLEDRASRSWTTAKYTLSLGICPSLAPQNRNRAIPSPIAVVDGRLDLLWKGNFYVCDLMEGTLKMYPRHEFSSSAMYVSHQISLASLKNCKSTISINKDGEVVE